MKLVNRRQNLNLLSLLLAIPLLFACNSESSDTKANAAAKRSKSDPSGAYYQKTQVQGANGQSSEVMTWVDPNQQQEFTVCTSTDPAAVTAKDKNNRTWGYENGKSCKSAADMGTETAAQQPAAAPAAGQQQTQEGGGGVASIQ